MIREIIKFTSEIGDDYEVEVIEMNHRVFGVIPTITLNNASIPPELFQNVIDHLIILNKYDIRRVYFENVRINYRFITIQLFGHVRNALKKDMRTPRSFEELKNGVCDYRWVEKDFLPVIPPDLEMDLYYIEKKIKNLYFAFRKGKLKGVPYELDPDYKIVYNYFFEVDETDIKPKFEVYVNTKEPKIPEETLNILLGKFENLRVKLRFKE